MIQITELLECWVVSVNATAFVATLVSAQESDSEVLIIFSLALEVVCGFDVFSGLFSKHVLTGSFETFWNW